MGVLLMLLSSACFATMAALIKMIGTDLPLSQMVFLRCALAVPMLLIFILYQGRPLIVKAKKVILLRTLFGMTAMHCFFYALTHMPLADCTFISRTQPLLLALFAPFVLSEKTPRAAWGAIITGLAGAALIIKPAMAWPLAAWVALTAAAASAGAHLLVRRLSKTDPPLVIVFNFTLLTGFATSFNALPGFVPLSLQQWFCITGVAVFASLGQFFMTSAYGKDRAPAVAAASYSSVILSVAYGYFFWQEIPEPLAWRRSYYNWWTSSG